MSCKRLPAPFSGIIDSEDKKHQYLHSIIEKDYKLKCLVKGCQRRFKDEEKMDWHIVGSDDKKHRQLHSIIWDKLDEKCKQCEEDSQEKKTKENTDGT